MSKNATSFRFSECERGGRLERRILAIVAVSLVAASGCGSGSLAFLPQASVEIIRGKDSAGAVIELEKRGENLTAARVIDMILGTGEAEIISDQEGQIEFTIDFPAGATIVYVGTVQEPGASAVRVIAGTWTQQSGGIFGEDTGTWRAPEAAAGS